MDETERHNTNTTVGEIFSSKDSEAPLAMTMVVWLLKSRTKTERYYFGHITKMNNDENTEKHERGGEKYKVKKKSSSLKNKYFT